MPGRLPNHSKERWRRLADKAFPNVIARDAKVITPKLSTPTKTRTPTSKPETRSLKGLKDEAFSNVIARDAKVITPKLATPMR